MIKLVGGALYQWDEGRKVEVIPCEGKSVDYVHYSNGMAAEVSESEGHYTARIPNILLQSSEKITVYAVAVSEEGVHTTESCAFFVSPKPKPDDYVYTETEMFSYLQLDKKIEESLKTKADLVDGKVPESQLPKIANSWNDLEDKPFSESKAFEDIVWDGNTEGLLAVNTVYNGISVVYYKVSDLILSEDVVIGGEVNYPGVFVGSSGTVTEEITYIYNRTEAGSFGMCGIIAFSIAQENEQITNTNMGFEATFPETGLYFLTGRLEEEFAYTSSLIAPFVIKTLDPKFIDEAIKLPSYSTADEGKVLKIVNGIPQWVSQ